MLNSKFCKSLFSHSLGLRHNSLSPHFHSFPFQQSSLVLHETLPSKSFGLRVSENSEQDQNDHLLAVMGLNGGHHVIEPIAPRGDIGDDHFHEKGELHELTQLSSHDIKFDSIDFHAEFIAQPVCFPAVISSLSEMRTTTTDWSDSVTSSFSHLPSFTDTYTPSVITTIEPRAFGAEAEYISRLKQRRESSSERSESGGPARSSVIVPVVGAGSNRDGSPSPSLTSMMAPAQYDFLSCPSESISQADSDGSHLTLKTEPEAETSTYYPHSPTTYSPRLPSPVLPNFLHFTPDESVSPRLISQNPLSPATSTPPPLKHANAVEAPAK